MRLLQHIFQGRKHSATAQQSRGFAIAPILYLLGLIGVGAGVLFSGYSQILRSNQTMSNMLAAKNDLQGSATTLAASSWLATNGQNLCPPMVGTGASANCTGANGAVYMGTSFANATAGNLPAGYASAGSTGSPVEVGVFKAGSGAKVLDPWGHYYVYCRWENVVGSANALMIISAGANGKLETKCGDTTAQGDNVFVVWTTAVTQNRAATWQTTTSGTAVTGTTFGQTGSQVYIDTQGDMTLPGNMTVNGGATVGTGGLSVGGATNLTGALTGTTGVFSAGIAAASGAFSGAISAGSATFSGALTAGSSTLSSLAVTNNGTVGGTLGVTGATTLGTLTAGSSTLSSASISGSAFVGGSLVTSNGYVQIGTSVVASGSSSPLLTVGKAVSSVYPFYVDQYGAATASSFNGNLNGSQSGGSVSATTLAASGATTLGGSLTVTGATALNSTLTGTSATFSGTVTAANFNGNLNVSGGGGTTITGVLPIANGGTGASNAASALSNLFSGAGTISQLIPGADLANNSVTSTQLSATGVTAGTYSSVTVGADGRVTAGTGAGGLVSSLNDGSGDSVSVGTANGIQFSIGSSTIGNWNATGLMVGSSKSALDKLDVYGGVAIGTGYAGVTAAPTNGLIVQGQVAIGTTAANGALNVNGAINATVFNGSGAGLTNIGTSALAGTVAAGNGGTGTNVVFTQGSVVYAGAGGVYSQDNTNFYYDGTNHRLGLGTSAPTDTLNVYSTGDASALNVVGSGAAGEAVNVYSYYAGNGGAGLTARTARGTSTSPAASQTGDRIGYTVFGGYTGSTFANTAAIEAKVDAGTVSGTSLPTYLTFATTPNGSVTRAERMRIDENGNVGIGTTMPFVAMHLYNSSSSGVLTAESPVNSAGYQYSGQFVVDNTSSTWSRLGFGQISTNNFFIETANQANAKGNTLLQPWGGGVGIGTVTVNPSTALQVVGTVTATQFTGSGAGLSNTTVPVASINASGTASASTYLRGDGSWASLTTASLPPLASANLWVGNVSSAATAVAMSGDVTMANTGATTIGKIQGTTVSGVTGTGNVVLSASPTFSGTVTGGTFAGTHTGNGSGLTSIGTSALGGITGTANATTFLRGDGTWSALSASNLPALSSTNIWVGNASNAATAVAVSGDCTLSNAGAITCTKTSGTSFGSLATASTVNLSTQATGTLQAAQEPAHTGDVTNTAGALATTVAKIQGTTVSGVTGTGNVVFSASPTFSGTVTGGTFAGTHTGNGSGLTSIGVSALGGISGTASSSTYLRGDGTWAALSLSGGTANYAARWTSATTLGTGAIYDNGSAVGINNTSPATALDVAQNTSIKVGQAYLSSGGDYVHLANNEWYNGSAWTQTAVGALLQLTGQSFNFYTHTASGGGHTTILTINSSGITNNYSETIAGNLTVTGSINSTSNYVYGNELYSRDNLYLGYLGDWISNRLGQDVRNGASPTFGETYTNGWFRVNGGGGIYWQAYGGGWYMQDSTWIRSYNGKYLYESAGFDTGGASGVNCGGGLGGGYTFRVCGSFQVAGDMWSNNYYHNSDRRLKDNIKPIKGLEIIEQLNGVTFTWKKDGTPSAGVIAQDVQKVMPEAVTTTQEKTLAVSYDSLLAPVIEAIKELKHMFVAFEDKFAKLAADLQGHDARITKLENAVMQLQAVNDNNAKEIAALRDEVKTLKAAKAGGAKP